LAATTFALAPSPVLFGADSRPGIVAIDPLGDQAMELVVAGPDGRREILRQRFHPCAWVATRELLAGYAGPFTLEELAGNGELRFLVTVPRGRDLEDLRRHLRSVTGAGAETRNAPYFLLPDRVHLHLLRTGQTLFKGLALTDLRRLDLDIETDCDPAFEFSNPDRESDRVLSIAVSDSTGFETVISAAELAEPAMLDRLAEVIRERDPDVIAGHNLFKFDLEYLHRRAARYGKELFWGRDGRPVRRRPSRVMVAERVLDVPRWEVRGRHFVDTWLLVQFYDVTSRELESFALKDVAQHFGLAAADREFVAGPDITPVFRTDPERIHRYNLGDARDVGRIANLLLPSYFIQAQIFPYTLHNVIVRGNATKINALFVREHLRRGWSLPALPELPPSGISGGYTTVFRQGIVGPVLHADVRSLYPSIMLASDIRPARDELGLLSGLLHELRAFRLEARRAMARAETEIERRHLDALQSTFKILINSFYGYLGSTFANWADAAAANEVTRQGREILHAMLAAIRARGGEPIEVDTDGVYFVPPESAAGDAAAAEAFVAELGADLPGGIQVELAGRYQAMLSYKAKNYALLEDSGRVAITGSGLRSRGLERYLREFLHDLLRLALSGRTSDIPQLYAKAQARLKSHGYTVRDFMKTETLADSLAVYRAKVAEGARNRGAAYELAIASGRDLRPGDAVSYYVTGDSPRVKVAEAARPVSAWKPERPDENTAYYLAKLRELFAKFAPLAGVEIDGQIALDLG
jgi:DNA polymerase elongation subunit (family B)